MRTAPAERVFVLGAGRAGLSLAAALHAAGVGLVAVHGRRPWCGDLPALVPLPHTSGTIPVHALRAAGVVLVTVRDAQLDEALHELAGHPLQAGAVVLHASGARTPAAAAALRAQGVAVGTFHPLLPLAEPAQAARRLRQAWIGLDGDAAAVAAGERLAAALGARTLRIPEGQKGGYHAAAVLASNMPVALAVLASGLLRQAGVAADAADGAVKALLAGAVRNLDGVALDAEGGARALTGPLARGDVETVRANLDALAASPAARAAYVALAAATLDMLAQGGAGAPWLDEAGAVLDAAREGGTG